MAQNKSMNFKGLSMDCTVEAMSSQLQTQGYKYEGKDGKLTELEGSYAGTGDCDIYIKSAEGSKMVEAIIVKLPECDSWGCLEGKYMDLKKKLEKKYGKGESTEKFERKSNSDGEMMSLVRTALCKYESAFKTDGGTIRLVMINGFDACVMVIYSINNVKGGKANDSNDEV